MAALGLLVTLAWGLALASGTLGECPERPSKELVCYYEGRTPVSQINACLCTSIVFTRAASLAKDNVTFTVDVGMRSSVRALKKENPDVRALLQLTVPAAQLKTEERRQRASQAVSAALRKSTADGVELQVDWTQHGSANKTHITTFLKAVRFQLDSADDVDRRRFKRDYEIFESRTTKVMSTTVPTTNMDTAETVTDTTEPSITNAEPVTTDVIDSTITDNDEVTVTTEGVTATATTPRSVTRTTRAEGSTAADADDLEYGLEDELLVEVGRILTLRLPAQPELLAKYYDMRPLSKFVDWFTLSSHNLTDASERGYTYHHSRLMGLDDMLNTDSLIDLVTGLGAPKSLVVISLPAFALKFTLQDISKTTPRSPVAGSPVVMSQIELCSMLSEGGWSVERDQDLTAPYAFRNTTWVSFEDHMSVNIKGKYVLLRDLAGAAIQSLDDEDWLETSCKPEQHAETAETTDKAYLDADYSGDYHGDYSYDGDYDNAGRSKRETKETEENKQDSKISKKHEKKVEEPMPATLVETLFKSLTVSARRTRAALLSSLQDDIHQHATAYEDFSGDVKLSPYQIVRVVDREGAIHVVRKNAQTEFKCSRQGYFVHPLSCNRFYRCVKFDQRSSDYTVFEYDCPAGLAFDERVEVCVWPGSLPDGACHGSSEIAPVPRNQMSCPGTEGYYADPENCRWFFACLDHARDGITPLTAYEFRCPFGLVFDETNQVCNWPWLVEGCGGSGRLGVIRFGSAGNAYQAAGGAYSGIGVGIVGSGAYGRGSGAYAAGGSGAYGSAGSGAYGSGGSGAYGSGGSGVYNAGALGAFGAGNSGASDDAGLISGLELLGAGVSAEDLASNGGASSGYDSGSYGLRTGSAQGATATNNLNLGAGVAFNSGVGSLGHSSSGAGSSGVGSAAYNKLGASLYKQTDGVSGSSLASEINSNLGSGAYVATGAAGDYSSGTVGRYGENNGYIAFGAGAHDAASRNEDRGYSGFATIPDSSISGGRIENSGGVVLGGNLHSFALKGIDNTGRYRYDGSSGSSGYSAGGAGLSSKYVGSSGAYNSGSAGSATYVNSNAGSATYDDGSSSVSYNAAGSGGDTAKTVGNYNSFGLKTIQKGSGAYGYDGSSGSSASTVGGSVSYNAGSSGASAYNGGSSGSSYNDGSSGTVTYQAGNSGSSVYGAGASAYNAANSASYDASSAAYNGGDAGSVVNVQGNSGSVSYNDGSSTIAYTSGVTGGVSGSIAGQSSGYRTADVLVQSDGNSGYSGQLGVIQSTVQSVTPTPATVSYQANQVHSVTPAYEVRQSVTPAPGVVTYQQDLQSVTPVAAIKYEIKQPVVQFQTVTPAPGYVSYSTQGQKIYPSSTPATFAQVKQVSAAPTFVSYIQQKQKTYQPVTPVSVIQEVKQPVIEYQSVTPTPGYAFHSNNQQAQGAYQVVSPAAQLHEVHNIQSVTSAPASVSYQTQQQQHKTYQSYSPSAVLQEVEQPVVQVQSVTPAPAAVSYNTQQQYKTYQSGTPAAVLHEVKQPLVEVQSVTPAPGYVSYSTQAQNNNVYQRVTPAAELHVQSVTSAPASVSYQTQQQQHKTYQTYTPSAVLQEVKQPVVQFQSVTPAPAAVSYNTQQQYKTYQSSTPAAILHEVKQPFVQVQSVTPAPAAVSYNTQQQYKSYQSVTSAPVLQEVKRPVVQFQSVTPTPGYVSVGNYQQDENVYQAVTPAAELHQVKHIQSVTPAPAFVSYNSQNQYTSQTASPVNVIHKVQQPVVEVQSYTPASGAVSYQSEQVHFTPTPAPPVVSYTSKAVTPAFNFKKAFVPVQPVTPVSTAVSFGIQQQTYQGVTPTKIPVSVNQDVNYYYSTPAPFQLKSSKMHKIVDISMPATGYYQPYGAQQQTYHEEQNVKQVQPLPKYHSSYQQVKQVQPITNIEYQAPAVEVQQQVQEEVKVLQPVVQYQQEIKQVQPVTKYQYEAPVVQYQQYQEQQKVKQIQPNTQYYQEVRPISKFEYQAPGVQYEQRYQQVQQVQPVSQVKLSTPVVQYPQVKQTQPVSKVEYQVPALQYNEYQQTKQERPVVQYHQEVQPITKVEYQVPSVQYVEQQKVKAVKPISTVQYPVPVVHQQQYEQVQYNQEVKQVQPVTKIEYQAPVVQYQQNYETYSSTPATYVKQPEIKLQEVRPKPVVTNFQKAQEVVYSYSTPLSYPILEDKVETVQYAPLKPVSYQTPVTSTPAPVTYNPRYSSPVAFSVSTTPATLQGYSSYDEQKVHYSSAAPTVSSTYSNEYYGSTGTKQASVVSKTPLVQSFTYTTPSTDSLAYTQTGASCVTCSKSTVGLHVSTTPSTVVKQPTTVYQETYVSSTPKSSAEISQVNQGSVYVNDERQYGVLQQVQQVQQVKQVQDVQQQQYDGFYGVKQTVEEEPPVALFVQTPKPVHQRVQVTSTPFATVTDSYYSTPRPVPSVQYTSQQNIYSSTAAPEVAYEIPKVNVQQPPVSQISYQRYHPKPLKPIVVADVSTAAPAISQPAVYSTTTYSTERPEVYSKEYYSTPRPQVIKTVLTQEQPAQTYVNVEEPGYIEQNLQFGAKTTGKVISEYNYVQGGSSTSAPLPEYAAIPETVQYQTTPSPPVEDVVTYTTAKPVVPLRRLRPTTTAAPYVESQEVNVQSQDYNSVQQNIPISSTPAYLGVSQESYRGNLRYNSEQGAEVDGILDQYAGNFGGREEYVNGVISQHQSGVQVNSADGYANDVVSTTIRSKPKKRTKIVVVTRISDVNPLLIGKLGAQCSCQSNQVDVSRRRRPGLKRVVSRVRVVRPKAVEVASERYASSTTEQEDYSISSSTAKAIANVALQAAAKAVEYEEDIALIRDSEKDDDDDDEDNDADFGAVVSSSTARTSSASYEDEEVVSSSVSPSSTLASRGRSRSRGRTTFVRAGEAKSTIYVSTTSEPDVGGSSSTTSNVYEVTSSRSRKATSRTQDDSDAVVIAPRPKSGRARGDNEVAPGPGQTVDLGVQGVVECKRPGLFRHPELCNKFYSCNWDSWKKKYVVSVFNCPIHLAYDTSIGACNWPSKGPACVNGKLLV